MIAAAENAGLVEACEIVVIDDGSTDNTPTAIKRAFDASTCQLLRHPGNQNRGVSATRNLGIASSDSRYVTFLDGDDTFCSNRFDCVNSILENDPEVDAVYGDTVVVIEDESQHESWQEGQFFGVGESCRGTTLLKRLIHSKPWATSAITVRRKLFAKTGVFNEQLSVAEDCHLWMRMAAIGNVVPDGSPAPVSVYHRQADSLYRAGVENKWHYSQALRLFYRWLKQQNASPEIVETAQREIAAWLDNTLIQLRFERRTKMLLRMISSWSTAAPGLALRPRNLSHAAHAVFGR